MSLRGNALLVVLVVVAVVMAVSLVLDVPRLRRPVGRYLRRTGQAVVLCGSVVAISFALLNNEYVFYTDWSDLLSAGQSDTAMHNGATAGTGDRLRVPGGALAGFREPRTFPPLTSPGQQVQSYQVTGTRSHVSGQIIVSLPPGYDPSSSHRYPVIEGLHGYPGTPLSALRGARLAEYVDAAMAAHRLAPSILVLPQINNPPDLDTECMNIPHGPQVDTWLASDVPRWVASHFRVDTARTGWASLGYSFGGFCSADLGIRHSRTFGAAAVLLGYFRPDFEPGYVPVKPGSPVYQEYDLVRQVERRPPPTSMWILTSKQDPLSYPSTIALLDHAKAPLSVNAIVLATGGHRTSVFLPHLPRVLDWLARTLEPFSPKAPGSDRIPSAFGALPSRTAPDAHLQPVPSGLPFEPRSPQRRA